MTIPEVLVWPLCLAGFAVFSVAVGAARYMQSKTGKPFTGWMRGYEELVNERGYSRWPIRLIYICTPMGIIICFGAILLSPPTR